MSKRKITLSVTGFPRWSTTSEVCFTNFPSSRCWLWAKSLDDATAEVSCQTVHRKSCFFAGLKVVMIRVFVVASFLCFLSDRDDDMEIASKSLVILSTASTLLIAIECVAHSKHTRHRDMILRKERALLSVLCWHNLIAKRLPACASNNDGTTIVITLRGTISLELLGEQSFIPQSTHGEICGCWQQVPRQ